MVHSMLLQPLVAACSLILVLQLPQAGGKSNSYKINFNCRFVPNCKNYQIRRSIASVGHETSSELAFRLDFHSDGRANVFLIAQRCWYTGTTFKTRRLPGLTMGRPKLTIKQILAWADAHHAQTGRWPTQTNGTVQGAPGEKWSTINGAMHTGCRGFRPKGMSLPKLLAKYRGRRNQGKLPKLTIKQILEWADEHHERTGEWPNYLSGPILGTTETWSTVANAIRRGRRGLRPSTLPRLLYANRDLGRLLRPVFTLKQILQWADQHHEQTGKWPRCNSGPVPSEPRISWQTVHYALQSGKVGSKKTSLFKLLKSKRDARRTSPYPKLTVEQILAWADDHFQRTGEWPRVRSGPILAAPHETWQGINQDLMLVLRGLQVHTTLIHVLAISAEQQQGYSVGYQWRRGKDERRNQ